MEKKMVDMMKKVDNEMALVLRCLEEYHRDVRTAIEAVTNAPYELVETRTVCSEMRISPNTLRRYTRQFDIPVHKIGNKNFYFMAEVKNCIITRLRIWNR